MKKAGLIVLGIVCCSLFVLPLVKHEVDYVFKLENL